MVPPFFSSSYHILTPHELNYSFHTSHPTVVVSLLQASPKAPKAVAKKIAFTHTTQAELLIPYTHPTVVVSLLQASPKPAKTFNKKMSYTHTTQAELLIAYTHPTVVVSLLQASPKPHHTRCLRVRVSRCGPAAVMGRGC